eukprot:976570-Rhodomonas_salina.1
MSSTDQDYMLLPGATYQRMLDLLFLCSSRARRYALVATRCLVPVVDVRNPYVMSGTVTVLASAKLLCIRYEMSGTKLASARLLRMWYAMSGTDNGH